MCTGSLGSVISRRAPLGGAIVAITFVTFVGGCADFMALALVRAPNQTWKPQAAPPTPQEALDVLGVAQELRIDVGPPDASLSIWIVDPQQPSAAQSLEPRGTVLVLHGLYSRKEMMLGVGKQLAGAGYRSVLVDFRGQGMSSGAWLTFGAVETTDLSQVINTLEDEGLIAGPIGVYGTSFGGGVGIQLAGADERVRAVVAIAPFQSLDAVYAPLVRGEGPLDKFVLSDALLDEALRRAAEFAEFDLSSADALAAIERTNARVMLVHGKLDTVVPYQQSVALATAAGDRARLVLLDWADHSSIMLYQHGPLMAETLAWFGEWLEE